MTRLLCIVERVTRMNKQAPCGARADGGAELLPLPGWSVMRCERQNVLGEKHPGS